METVTIKKKTKKQSTSAQKEPSLKMDKLQSRIKIKPYFCNYCQFLFNPANYLKCDSSTLDFSELPSITLLCVSFSKVKCALIV